MKITINRYAFLAVAAYLALTTLLASSGNDWNHTVRPWLIWPWGPFLNPTVCFLRENVLFEQYGLSLSVPRLLISSILEDTFCVIVGSAWWYGLAILLQRILNRIRQKKTPDYVRYSSGESKRNGARIWKAIFVICVLTVCADGLLIGLRYQSAKERFALHIEEMYRWNKGHSAGKKYPFLLNPGMSEAVIPTLPFSSIELERTPCFGTCQAYRLTLSRDGRARYEGLAFVKMMGVYTGEVDCVSFAHLCNAMERLNFIGMDDKYYASWTDDLSTILTLIGDGTNLVKRVDEYGGFGPIELWTLQQAVDAVGSRIEWKITDEKANKTTNATH